MVSEYIISLSTLYTVSSSKVFIMFWTDHLSHFLPLTSLPSLSHQPWPSLFDIKYVIQYNIFSNKTLVLTCTEFSFSPRSPHRPFLSCLRSSLVLADHKILSKQGRQAGRGLALFVRWERLGPNRNVALKASHSRQWLGKGAVSPGVCYITKSTHP